MHSQKESVYKRSGDITNRDVKYLMKKWVFQINDKVARTQGIYKGVIVYYCINWRKKIFWLFSSLLDCLRSGILHLISEWLIKQSFHRLKKMFFNFKAIFKTNEDDMFVDEMLFVKFNGERQTIVQLYPLFMQSPFSKNLQTMLLSFQRQKVLI